MAVAKGSVVRNISEDLTAVTVGGLAGRLTIASFA